MLPGKTTADIAETRGGLTVRSADGQFEGRVSARIHFDTYLFDNDIENSVSTTEFRRARLTLRGKLHDWEYTLENDFAGQDERAGSGFRSLFMATRLGPGQLTIGQFKPYRGMEELTSSNHILMMERPFASATGIHAGRQWQQGVGYLVSGSRHTLGVSGFNTRAAGATRNDGLGAAGRVTATPVMTEQRVVHLGASFSHENGTATTPAFNANALYAGRRGPSQRIATTLEGGRVDALGLEAALAAGGFFAQAEYVAAEFQSASGPTQRVNAHYLQGGYTLNRHRRPYDAERAVFRSPTGFNVVQLTARYDHIENSDMTDMQAESITFGINYFANPAVRFMANYTLGDNTFTGDRTRQLAIRAQLAF
ncbi:OprO/OprP family phosphate-selective porin [Isoalcanivorax indicus]|uniref:OprO/OprP family phosphate-selective porin n=1 Tax=Isoalcanivorax indicus TaxID=2202653 RepID=UPI0013C534A7|nr:porin [Isoalcanivorax indicus]